MKDELKNKYSIIYADPAWSFKNKNTGGSMKSGASAHYKTTSLKEMQAMPVDKMTTDNAVLIMWYVGSQGKEAYALAEAWGFQVKNINGFVWNKLTQTNKPHFGLGFYTRAGSESCLIATKGKFKPTSKSVRAVFNAEEQIQFEGKISIHSKKPPQVRDLIVELCGDLPRLEMFARQTAEGWDSFGNQVENSIEF